ncbi:hypothetical protein SaPhSE2_gp29 [Salmonella phage SE2]|uniref:Uncharacterized protein n=2 Tax=Jerseyvirus TaxID=1910991 RepID=H2EQG8_9CAUD|nr:hypothetical protein SaPhSE2_gp29 [Salmonella phage SE2]YP_009280135.1 hypothetical protein BI170_gp07 [Salmonella phage MA12]YP_010746975.1 hypothetical protein QA039_gp21 [Salmonella phage vB_SenS_S528]ASZ77916.1 hypothetical protein [Salmonella phage ST3]ASZ78243.1 hypothetical protein [Salmonella phage ST1]AWY02996.1 hypothetical protein [Salmonella phage vB_SpuS_Sp4]AZU99473.1 hypothetical protein AP3_021 [Salmonella phage TS3]QGZ13180.1 hypothetical protein W71701E2_20 [Salmonella p
MVEEHYDTAYITDTSPHMRAFLYTGLSFPIQSLIDAQGVSDAL